jgi:HlyD family secretion protein
MSNPSDQSSTQKESTKQNTPSLSNIFFTGRNRIIIISAAAILILIALFSFGSSSVSSNIPTFTVKKDNFLVSLTESGEISAKNSISIAAPRVRGGLKIIHLVPEGTYIKKGDVVAKFDPTDAMTKLREAEAQLEIAMSNKDKLLANQKSEIAKMESDLKSSELGFELSQLNIEQMKFEAEAKRREAELQHKKNELSYEQTKQSFASKKIIQQSELANIEVEIRQKKNELEKVQREVNDLTLTAEAEGLVVYGTNWSNQGRKFQIGDQAWGGQSIINLPDLSIMESQTSVNEVDVSKIKVEQEVKIKLDAFQDTTFHGNISDVAKLGKEKDSQSKIKVFEIKVLIDGTSEILKPGMTTSNQILIKEVPDTIFIPQEAVFEKDGKYIVYLKDGSSYDEVEVTLGDKSEDHIIVESGLKAGDIVALSDPYSEDKEIESSAEENNGVQMPSAGN